MKEIKYIFIIFLLPLGVFACMKKSKKPLKWVETIGILYPWSDKNGYGEIIYKDTVKVYASYFSHRHSNSVKGEIYTMRYNAYNPSEVEIDYWNPIFLPTEKTDSFDGIIEKVHPKSFLDPSPFIVYSFTIATKKITSAIYLQPDYKEVYPNLKDGNHYKVECLDANKSRIVIHLDQQIYNKY